MTTTYLEEIRNAKARTNEAKAQLWESLLERGAILTFEGAGGAVITAGPNHTATGTGPAFSLYREQGDTKWRGSWEGSAWGIALRIVDHVGRKAPIKISQGRAPVRAL